MISAPFIALGAIGELAEFLEGKRTIEVKLKDVAPRYSGSIRAELRSYR